MDIETPLAAVVARDVCVTYIISGVAAHAMNCPVTDIAAEAVHGLARKVIDSDAFASAVRNAFERLGGQDDLRVKLNVRLEVVPCSVGDAAARAGGNDAEVSGG